VTRSPSRHIAGAARSPWRKARIDYFTKSGERSDMAKINPGEFMRQVQAEARKVVWPTRQETITTAIFVGIMMVILAVFFLGIDSLFGTAVKWLLSLV
jgi:preprotein translocase subunit SecE